MENTLSTWATPNWDAIFLEKSKKIWAMRFWTLQNPQATWLWDDCVATENGVS